MLVHCHLILLAADVCLQTFHIGSIATEISTVVLVDTREVAAVHIGGGCHCVLPHIIGRRKFNAHQAECLCRIAVSQHPVTGSIEVKMVGSAAQPLGGDNSAVLYHLRQHSNYLVHACTNTTVVGIHHFTGNQGHLVSLQMKVSKQVVVYALHLLGPLLVTGVRLALMQKYPFYHTAFLCNACHLHQTGIRVVVILFQRVHHPVGSCFDILPAFVFLESSIRHPPIATCTTPMRTCGGKFSTKVRPK